jgi:hypothetical protein
MYARLREDFLAAQRNPEDIRGTRDEVRPGG